LIVTYHASRSRYDYLLLVLQWRRQGRRRAARCRRFGEKCDTDTETFVSYPRLFHMYDRLSYQNLTSI